MQEFITNSPAQTRELACALAHTLKGGEVLAFTGGLGMGKTAFTVGLAMGLGIDPREVTSPTFALVNEYRGGRLVLCHFDMYRVESYASLESTGFFDYLDSGAVLAVEWSENILGALPKDTININLERLDENTRRITIDGGEQLEYTGD